MLGNVYQWTADWYDVDYYGRSESTNPVGPPGGTMRVLRGGSWYYGSRAERVSNRIGSVPENYPLSFGFRCAAE
jgi:formylglycine-generating enzyme required for sulfatase activity